MAVLDLTPAPGAAPASRRILAHASMEARLIVRNGEQLLLALVIPIAILVGAHVLGTRFGLTEQEVAPSVMALAIFSTCFTSLAIATGFERRYGVLERLAATPLRKSGLLAGKAVSIASIATVQVLVLAAIGAALGWRPHPGLLEWVVLVVGVPLAMIALANLALCLAGTLRAEATLGLANLIYLVGLALGGILWPVHAFPASIRPVVSMLPTAALGEICRDWSAGATHWWPLGVLVVWAVLSGLLARKVFRWTS